MPGTEGETPPIAPTAEQAAQSLQLASDLEAQGWSPFLCQLAGVGTGLK